MHSENIVATARLGRLPATNIIARREASIRRWRPSDGKGKVVGLYICTMRRYAPSQYQQVLLRAPTAALYCISSPTTASTFALACCDDFCQRRAKLYLTYCKRAFGKPQSGKSAQQARANAYFFRRSVACIAIPRPTPLHQLSYFGTLLTVVACSRLWQQFQNVTFVEKNYLINTSFRLVECLNVFCVQIKIEVKTLPLNNVFIAIVLF